MAKERLEFELKGNVKSFSDSMRVARGDIKQIAAAIKESSSSISIGKNSTAEMRKIKTEAESLLKTFQKFQSAGKINLSDLTPKQRATVSGAIAGYKETIKGAQPSVIEGKAAKERTTQERALAKAEADRAKQEKLLQREAAATEKADISATKSSENRAITLRYALYDVASVTRQASAAMLGFSGAVLQAGMDQQTAFSQVEKTQVGAGAQELDNLRHSLQQLSTEIPVTFSELSKLSMLGAQLGIDSSSLDEFSATVAKFSTVTGVTIEDAALKFGKLSTLLNVPAEQFDKLASSIAYVGVNGASTEAAILSTAQQISAVARAAGFTATEVIGLSSALASLGVSPEEARGVLIPTFHEMDAAVVSFNTTTETGNERLKTFAAVAGMTAAEFSAAWGDKAGGGATTAFNAFVAGLGSGSIDSARALRQLGLDGTRTSKGLTALGNDAEFVFSQMADAAKGFENDFLGDAFAKTADDISAKLEMLNASFENLMAGAGSNPVLIGLLGALIDSVKWVNVEMKKLLDNSPTLSFLLGLATAAVAVTGAIAGLATIMLTARAGMFALQTAFYASGGAANTLMGSLLALSGRLFGIGSASVAAKAGVDVATVSMGTLSIGSTIAAASVTLLGAALKSIGIGLVIAAIAWLVDETIKLTGSTGESTNAAEDNKKAIDAQREALNQLRQELIDNVDMALQGTDDYLSFQGALYSFGKGLQDTKNNFDATTSAGKTNMENLRSVISTMTASANGDTQLLANNLAGLAQALKVAGITAGPAMQMIQDAISGTSRTAIVAVPDMTAFNNGLKDTTKSAGRAKTALEKLKEALEAVFAPMDATANVQQALDDLGASFAKNGKAVGYSTDAMRENFKAIKDVINAFADSSNGNLKQFSGNLLALRASLVQLGVVSPTAFAEIDKALKKINTKAKVTSKDIKAIYSQISGALAEEQKKSLRTVLDYVSDLSNVLRDAFENRYGNQSARDSITTAWNSIRDAAAAAKESIDEANNSISEMKADKSILQYQLNVAIRYGDTLRAEAIKAKIAKLNDSLAAKEAEITKAQALQNKTLEGNTQAAIDNRATIRDLISAGNDYLITLARSGASSATLQTEAQKLADDFLEQGTQLGFAKSELEAYTGYFAQDFITVVKGLDPYKQIDIEVNGDPALAALDIFVSDANNKLAQIKTPELVIPVSYDIPAPPVVNGGGITSNGIGGGTTTTQVDSAAMKADKLKLTALNKQISDLKLQAQEQQNKVDAASYVFWNVKSSQANLDKLRALEYGLGMIKTSIGMVSGNATTLSAKIAKGGYATGGYVSGPGTGTSDSIPARLSNGEYVLKANAVRHYGTDFMNSLNQMQVQRPVSYGAGGSAAGGSSMVYLSPEDRQLLRAAVDRPIALYTENSKIAQSANAGNVLLAQRGTN